MHISRTRQHTGKGKSTTLQLLPFLFSQENTPFLNKAHKSQKEEVHSHEKARTFLFPHAIYAENRAHMTHNTMAPLVAKASLKALKLQNTSNMCMASSQTSSIPSPLQLSSCPPPPQSCPPRPIPLHPLSQKDSAFILHYYDYEGCEYHVQCNSLHEAISWAREEAEESHTNVSIYQLVHTELAP